MMKIRHEFVQYVPSNKEEGVLYISIQYNVAVHKCACGCGNLVVTPIASFGWELRFYGDTISLYPSIGNWNFKCKSHYFIIKNEVIWGSRWGERKVKMVKVKDDKAISNYFKKKSKNE